MSPPPTPVAAIADSEIIACRCCGLEHRKVPLERHEKAMCVRCDAMLERGRSGGWDRPLAWSVTGLVLAVPALFVPLATVDQLGSSHDGLWLSAIRALWLGHMPGLAVVVLFCGVLAPLLSLGLLVAMLIPLRRRGVLPRRYQPLLRLAHQCMKWSMPEVYLLAVLVAFIKLGVLVNVTVEPGLWCYAGVSLALIQGLQNFDFETAARSTA